MRSRSSNFIIPVLIGVVGFVLGATSNTLFSRPSNAPSALPLTRNTFPPSPTVDRQKGYSLINPLLDCDADFFELLPFKQNIEAFLNERIAKGDVKSASVYFRNMNNGYAFGINQDEPFSPASLMKVPFLIAALKSISKNPPLLNKPLVFKREVKSGYTGTILSGALEDGKTYTFQELLYYMISLSDNDAAFLVVQNIDQKVLAAVFSDLNLTVPQPGQNENYMTIRDYATFLRILYNASYLSRDASEYALNLLLQSRYKAGIVAGLPPDIKVAHKFGERILPEYKQLHDCGLVYYPNGPYLLCIMSRGNDFKAMATLISDLSRKIYDEVSVQSVKSVD